MGLSGSALLSLGGFILRQSPCGVHVEQVPYTLFSLSRAAPAYLAGAAAAVLLFKHALGFDKRQFG